MFETFKIYFKKMMKNSYPIVYLYDKDNKPYELINLFLDSLFLNSLHYNTLKAYAYSCSIWLKYLASKGIDYLDISDFKERFQRLLFDWIIDMETSGTKSQRTMICHIQRVLCFYQYYFLRIGDRALREFIEDRIEEYKRSGVFPYKDVVKSRFYTKITGDEFNQILKACNNLRDQIMLHLMYNAGFRIGEVQTLCWDNLYPAKNLINVNANPNLQTMAFSKTGPRMVAIDNFIFQLLDQYRNELKTQNRLFSQYVFTSRIDSNNPITYDGIRSFIKKLTKKTQIEFNPHMLRRSYAQKLFERGLSLKEIATQLGHTNIHTTERYYLGWLYDNLAIHILRGDEYYQDGGGI